MTPEFDRFVRPARARPQIWRLFLGIVVVFAVYILWVTATLAVAWAVFGDAPDPFVWLARVAEADTPAGTLLLLTTFVGMAVGPIAAARLLHGRPAGTLFGPPARTLRDFVVSASVVGVVLGASAVLWSWQYDALPNLDWRPWLALLPLTLLGLLVQTGAEELLFRGYLQSQLAARFRSPLAWLVLPAFVFGIVHFDPGRAGDNAWLVVGAAATFGLIAADLTARTGSIGAAWGFHFANNTFAVAILSTDGTITGLSRWITPYRIDAMDASAIAVATDVAALVLCWWLIRRVVTR